MHYNFVRIHKSLKVTPAMAAGVTETLWSLEDVVKMVDAYWEEKNKKSNWDTTVSFKKMLQKYHMVF